MKGVPRDHLEQYLYEFMWKERFGGNSFETILEHMRLYHGKEI
jgi:hypothetical protein